VIVLLDAGRTLPIMSLFKRRKPDPRQSIENFWVWWATGQHRVAAAIEAKANWPEDLVAELSELVNAIHPDLQWETTNGLSAPHALVVTAGGDPALRSIAGRWHRLAPPATANWEYHATRQASPEALTMTMTIAGRELDLAQLTFAANHDDDRHEIDVEVYHPGFRDLPEDAATQVAFLALDWLLGEDAVEIWIGTIEPTTDAPAQAVSGEQFAAQVRELATEVGDDSWALLEALTPSSLPLLAMVRQPLKPARWPRFDQQISVVLPYQSANDAGLPVDSSLDLLRAFEDRLMGVLDEDATLVAHETHAGRRTLHLRADAESDIADRVRAAAGTWAEGRAKVTADLDPDWEAIAHLRT
jgi:hypothetical protein